MMAEGSSGSSSGVNKLKPRGGRSFSSASLGCVADLVRWYLPVRTLVQFKVVSKEWRAWCDENLLQIAKERRKDESSELYFPLTHEGDSDGSSPGPRRWYGVHQGIKEQHALPDLDFLPFWNGDPRFEYDFEAASGGFLVVSKYVSLDNLVLIVCNPLSKKWRRLPAHTECPDRMMCGSYVYHGYLGRIHTHVTLGDLPNEYKVIRLSRDCVNVYSSSTNRWVCSPYNCRVSGLPDLSSVCFMGYVYILKMIEIVPVSGTFCCRYKLRIYGIESGKHETKTITSTNVVTQDYNEKSEGLTPREPILVGCMGNLYAVSASCQAGRNLVKPRRKHETYVSKCKFHIFTLTEEGRPLEGSWKHVVVPVELYSVKRDVLDFWEGCRYFSCVAKSNIICLSWAGRNHRDLSVYYLEYDVVSGLHATYTAGAYCRQPFFRGHGLAYSPCLDLEP